MNVKIKNLLNNAIFETNGIIEPLSIRPSMSGSVGVDDHSVAADVEITHTTTYTTTDHESTDKEIMYLEAPDKTNYVFSSNMGDDIKTYLSQMSPSTENYVKRYEKSMATGRDVDNEAGVDSVAFAGLKKA